MEDASAPSHPLVHMVDSASSVEAEDLFNNMRRIIITNLDTMARARARARAVAAACGRR